MERKFKVQLALILLLLVAVGLFLTMAIRSESNDITAKVVYNDPQVQKSMEVKEVKDSYSEIVVSEDG